MTKNIALNDLPFSGLLRELIAIGLIELAQNNVFESEESEMNNKVATVFERVVNQFENTFKDTFTSKIVLNDRSAYFVKSKRLVKWYGEKNLPQDYKELMIYVLKGTAELLRKNNVDFLKSIQSISVGKEVILGREYKDSLAIVPAVVKQAEFYEYQHEFLKPTAGNKPEILLDPIWFALMALGFLRCFAGYYGGKYYFVTKEGAEAALDNPARLRNIIEAIEVITSVHIDFKPTPYCEELYELRLSYGIASGMKIIQREVYPLKVYEISLVGNAYTCTKTMLLDLAESLDYITSYINNLQSMLQIPTEVKIKDLQFDNPLHALLELAERELRKPVEGDNSMIILTFVKDLYRAIQTRNTQLLEETLLRLLRISHLILSAKKGVNILLRETLKDFMTEPHIRAMITI